MNKKEIQIEELTQEIEFAKKGLWNAENLKKEDYSWHSRGIAEHLFSIGYRKIPKGSVVLSAEEYEELKHFKAKMSLPYLNIRKETAKEILNNLYGQINETDQKWFRAQIKIIAKQYGVEL